MSKEDELKLKEEELKNEIKEFNLEKERLKEAIGSIGRRKNMKKETIINLLFLFLVLLFFFLSFVLKGISSIITIETGVLLISLKMILLMQNQHKNSHFQFWILSTIEYRINLIDKRIKNIEKTVRKIDDEV